MVFAGEEGWGRFRGNERRERSEVVCIDVRPQFCG